MIDESGKDPLQAAIARLDAMTQRQVELLRRMGQLVSEKDSRDATIRRQTEEIGAMRQTLELTRRHLMVTEAAGIAQWELDIGAGRVALGTRWDEMLGEERSAGSWSLLDLEKRVHPEDVPAVRAALKKALREPDGRYMVEHRVAAAEGWIWLESMGTITERDASGAPLRITGFNTDVTARRTMHAEVEQARAQAEASNRAKSEFLANVSHEVRTPLNAVMGLTRLLHQSPLNPQQRQYIELIDRSSTSLLALLNDIRDLSNIEAGKLVFEQIRFDLARWIREAVALHTPAAEAKGLHIGVDIADGVPRKLEGDPGRLRQIISNLVSNAVKFTDRGRVMLTVRVAPNQVDLSRDQLRLLFAVRDTGVGISEEKQQQIFEAFTQADTSTTRRFGGSGLGLAICARLVAMMGGVIHVVSRPHEGSTFRFTAVFSQAEDELNVQTEPMLLEPVPTPRLDVLLAEDHAVNELLMRHLLAQMGHEVTVARDGEEAVRRWQSREFDLVLMDVQMPVLSGFDATARIRALEASRPRARRTPIVALTAHAMAGDRDKCLAAGMDAYVSKPVSPVQLAQAIREALEAAGHPAHDMLPDVDLGFGASRQVAQPAAIESTMPAPVQMPTSLPTSVPWSSMFDVSQAIDAEAFLQNMGGDLGAVREVVVVMRADMAERGREIQLAASARNQELVAEHAHTLKGALSSIAAHRAANAAASVHTALRNHDRDWVTVQAAVAALLREMERVDAALVQLA
ncbi:hypothetical protein BH10PSE18_BH10PSE18_04980 [soil metagenome]